jgi:hypothetical protein
MKKSILGINISTEFPFVKAGIPLTVGQNGHPIAFESDSKPVAWWLVCAETGEEFELDTVLLQYVNGVTYYNADANLFDYLETQGVTLGGGNFYYRFNIGGIKDLIITGTSSQSMLSVPDDTPYGEYEHFLSEIALPPSSGYLRRVAASGLNANNYTIAVRSTGAVLLSKNTPLETLFESTEVLSVGSSYTLKLVRNETTDQYVTGPQGALGVYIKGGSFGSAYQLMTASSGSNPVTDTEHNACDREIFILNSGEIITNPSKDGVYFKESDFTLIYGGVTFESIFVGGDTPESNVFRVDKKLAATPPASKPDWNSDWSNDFNI